MKFDQLNDVINILMNDDLINDVQVLRHGPEEFAVGFHTDLPTRKDDEGETYEDYMNRVEPDYDNVNDGGLSTKTINALKKLGMDLQFNDCEGLENEGIVDSDIFE